MPAFDREHPISTVKSSVCSALSKKNSGTVCSLGLSMSGNSSSNATCVTTTTNAYTPPWTIHHQRSMLLNAYHTRLVCLTSLETLQLRASSIGCGNQPAGALQLLTASNVLFRVGIRNTNMNLA